MSYLSLAFVVFLVCLMIVYVIMPNCHKWKTFLAFSYLNKLMFLLEASIVVYAASQKIEGLWSEFGTLC